MEGYVIEHYEQLRQGLESGRLGVIYWVNDPLMVILQSMDKNII